MVYPQQKVQITESNRGESFQELRKCLGVLGNYLHHSYVAPVTWQLGPTNTDAAGGLTADANTRGPIAVCDANSTYAFFVAAYGFEGFAKTAAESGINVSDRALPVVCEITRGGNDRRWCRRSGHPRPLRHLRRNRHDHLPDRRRPDVHSHLKKYI